MDPPVERDAHLVTHKHTHNVMRTTLYVSAQRVCDLREMMVIRVSSELKP